MRNKTSYEWSLEFVDQHGDIQYLDHADKLELLLKQYRETPTGEIVRHDLCLVQDIGNEEDGLQARGWVYVKDGEFDPEGDFDVPQNFVKELARA